MVSQLWNKIVSTVRGLSCNLGIVSRSGVCDQPDDGYGGHTVTLLPEVKIGGGWGVMDGGLWGNVETDN